MSLQNFQFLIFITVKIQKVLKCDTKPRVNVAHIHSDILGACVMGLYVGFPKPGLANGLVFSTAGRVDAFTGPGLVTDTCEGTWFFSSVFSSCGSLSTSPSPFTSTGPFSTLTFTLGFSPLLTQSLSFGWISLSIPWLVLLSSIICR